MALTAEQIRAAQAKLKGMRSEAAGLTNDLRAEVFRVTEAHRLRIQDAIVQALKGDGVITNAEIPRLSDTIHSETNTMLGELEDVINRQTDAMQAAAVQRAQAIASNLGIEGAFFVPTSDLLVIAHKFTADYISSVGAEAIAKINPILSRVALGGLSPFDGMKQITQEVIGQKGAAGVSYKAEMWVRTEVPKIYDTAFAAQVDAMLLDLPKPGSLKKTWVSGPNRAGRRETHQEMDGTTVPYDKPFVLPSGVRLDYPRAPGPDNAPEEVINCGCGWSVDADSMIKALEQ